MKSYKLMLAAGLTAGLLVISSGVVLAQGRQGSGNGSGSGQGSGQGSGPRACHGTGTCQMPGQGNGSRHGGGMQGQRNGHGRQGHGQGQGARGGNWETMLPPKVAGEVPAAVVAAMQDGIADEQHAIAVYAAVIEQFGAVRPFTNIQRSEAQHIAAWEFLFARYGLDVPAAPAVTVPEFGSLAAACEAAAAAEVANRDLYDKMLTTLAEYADMTQVVTQLRTVSDQKHLPAFARCAN